MPMGTLKTDKQKENQRLWDNYKWVQIKDYEITTKMHNRKLEGEDWKEKVFEGVQLRTSPKINVRHKTIDPVNSQRTINKVNSKPQMKQK